MGADAQALRVITAMTGKRALLLGLAGLSAFALLVLGRGSVRPTPPAVSAARVVISAPVQILLAGGDRFLAANFETIRAMSTIDSDPAHELDNTAFQIRSHRVVAQLNPCHEDNYYVANAMLSWGGASEEGMDVLQRAADCRSWDPFPLFYYGFNQWFFNRDAAKASAALQRAAERAAVHADEGNAVAMRRMSIMIKARQLQDEPAALAFLQREFERADDKLKETLGKRVARLQGLLALRDAQARYEARAGHALTDPQDLIVGGLLETFPSDPLRLGYVFENGRFKLRELNMQDREGRR